MHEVIAAIHGPGGIGGEVVPGVAFRTIGGEYICLRKEDAIMLLTEQRAIATAKSQDVVDRSKRLPEILR